jgi:hypothetical protein
MVEVMALPLTIRPARSVPGLTPAVFMAAALGWIGGSYPWPHGGSVPTVLVTLAHLVPVGVAVLAVRLVVAGRRAGRVALTALACAIKAMTVFAIVWAVTHPDGFGPHGFLDWVPIGLANAAGGLWLKSVLFGRSRA